MRLPRALLPIASKRASSAMAATYENQVLGGYTSLGYWHRHKRLAYTAFAFLALIYGFAYALFGRVLFVQLAVPLGILSVLVIWLLPDTGRAPVKLLAKLFFAFLIALMCWPDYLALALPGLPWITALRLFAIPLAIVMLICVSVSSDFRQTMKDVLGAAPAVWKLLVVFSVLALLSIAVSKNVAQSASKFMVSQLYWTLIFFVSGYVFLKEGRAVVFAFLIWAGAVIVCLIGIQEARISAVPWAGHIPSFLKIEDEAVQRVLAGSSRSAIGVHRVQSKFTTALGLAEFLAYAFPFVLHIVITARTLILRLLAFATIPLIFVTILRTDARLGMVGFFMALLVYGAFWAVKQRRNNKESMLGTAIIVAYPTIFCGFIAATFFIGRLRNIIWGTGAHQASTESRKTQFADGLPKVFSAPWGHGIGQGGPTLGFTSPSGILTIDTYYLAVALEFGVIGFLVYYGMFVAGIWKGAKHLFRATDRDTQILAPLMIALINFLIIKSIFSQLDNHPLIFAILGASVALIYRVRQQHSISL